jgi:AcrR family transcriptional regulator
VAVQRRRERARRQWVLDEAEAGLGVAAGDHEADADRLQRARVRRATIYRHFPDERALLLGCSGTWAERNPVPDPGAWTGIPDPDERLEAALDALYAWYERVEPMLSAVITCRRGARRS